jgi:hypothetical protein
MPMHQAMSATGSINIEFAVIYFIMCLSVVTIS